MMKSQYKLYVKPFFSFDPTEFDVSEISSLSWNMQTIKQQTILLNPKAYSVNVETPIVY